MGLQINGRSPAQIRYNGTSLAGLALGNKVVWREHTDSYIISVGINPMDKEYCSVTATGDIISITPNADKSQYLIAVTRNGKATVKIVAKEGYQVQQLNVDTVSQGTADTYTFDSVDANHTMYVWMAPREEEIPTDFLVRSDKPEIFYSSLHVAMNAVKNDYPDGLTCDVTISCIKECVEYRNPTDSNKLVNDRIWIAVLSDWNKGSRHSLIIDGNNQYTLSAYSLGGVFLKQVDNIMFRNLSIIDYSNFTKGYTPEEIAAIYSMGSLTDKNKNVAVLHCRFNGSYITPSQTGYAYYGIDTKLTENLVIDDCTFVKGGGQVIKCTDIDILEIKRSTLTGQHIYNIAHCNLVYSSGTKKLIMSDCLFDGESMSEYAFNIMNTDSIEIKRSRFTNISGQPLSVSGPSDLDINVESCLFDRCLVSSSFQYCRFIARLEQSVKRLIIRNNTFYMDGTGVNFQQVFSVNGNVAELVNYNNIYIDKANKLNAAIAVAGTIGSYLSGNNLYKAMMHSGGTRFNAMSILDNALAAFEKRSLKSFQDAGYETNSTGLTETDALLNVEAGGDNYALLPTLNFTYPADTRNVPPYDINYKLTDYKPTVGAYNLNGDSWDETKDTGNGYRGTHLEDNRTFDEQAVYTLPADDTALLEITCNDRTRFLRTEVYSSSKTLMRYGKFILFALECKVDASGAYLEDMEYSVKIEKL